MYKKIGEIIRQYRKEAGFTQNSLAKSTGLSCSFLGHIERGTRKMSLETMVVLINALKIEPNMLVLPIVSDELNHLVHQKRMPPRHISDNIIDVTPLICDALECIRQVDDALTPLMDYLNIDG